MRRVFRLRPLNTAKTIWKYSIIHRFNNPATGQTPNAGVIFGPDGALYGSTIGGGRRQTGILFRLAGSGDQLWSSFTILHHFSGSNPNVGPEGELLFNAAGNTIYGTTFGNGAYGYGTVFQLKKQTNGTCAFSTIHSFRNPYTGPPHDGALPRGRLVIGNDGGLYGTTESGDKTGTWNLGTVWRLKFTSGKWAYSIIHQFIGGDRDGTGPKSGLLKDSAGNFYGTASGGGARGAGVVYKLSLAAGTWRVTVLHSFDHGAGGDSPWSALVSSRGSLFGTTLQGGYSGCSTGCGVVYRLTP